MLALSVTVYEIFTVDICTTLTLTFRIIRGIMLISNSRANMVKANNNKTSFYYYKMMFVDVDICFRWRNCENCSTWSLVINAFFHLRQLRRVRRLLDAAATLIHAFVTCRIDYCNCLLANATKVWTDKLQRILNAAACCLTETNKYEPRLTGILHSDLQWLDVPERNKYKLCLTLYKCLHGMAPPYLSDLCISVAQIDGRRQLRSAARGQLVVPRIKLMTSGKRAFACGGSFAWNSLPDWLKDTSLGFGSSKSSLKIFLFLKYGTSNHYRDNLWYRAIAN